MHRLVELVRLHRMGTAPRRVARLLVMGPNTERQYRQALEAAGLLQGTTETLPERPLTRPRRPGRRLEEIVHGAGASIMATAHELIERGRAQGRVEGAAEGRAEGRAEGEARGRRATLVRMFRLKFQGAFTAALQARVEGADDAALDQWEERILTATTIDDVLG